MDTTEFMYFNLDGVILSSNGKPPKFVDQFIILGSQISFTQSTFSICISKAWLLSIGYRLYENLISLRR